MISLPPPSLLHANFVGRKERIFSYSWESNRDAVMLVQLHNHHTTNYCCVPNFTVELMPLPQSNTDRGHFPLSSRCKRDFFLGLTKPQDLAKSFYMIPTIASSPSLFLHSLDVRNPGPRLISPALGLTRIFFPDLVTSTKSSIHLW